MIYVHDEFPKGTCKGQRIDVYRKGMGVIRLWFTQPDGVKDYTDLDPDKDHYIIEADYNSWYRLEPIPLPGYKVSPRSASGRGYKGPDEYTFVFYCKNCK